MKKHLWGLAGASHWARLAVAEKSRLYTEWTNDPTIGGVLERFIDRAKVRVYIKDTLLKDYSRKQADDQGRPFMSLGIAAAAEVAERFTKPNGRRLMDGRVVCWGSAEDWKGIVMAAFVRARGIGIAPSIVLFRASGIFDAPEAQELVEDASRRLGVEHVVWLLD